MTVWHRVKREDGRAVLSGRQVAGDLPPAVGLWVATLKREDGGQTTVEAFAVGGAITFTRLCHCGGDRAGFWNEVTRQLFGVLRGVR